MMLREDKECSVCFLPYSRYERVPRVLHCEHTFCTPCLKLMAQLKDRLFTVRCPLCRQTTWIKPERGLLGTLWVDINKWDQISEEEEEEEEEEEDEEAEPEKKHNMATEKWPTTQI
ncbi:E3 ubiquitin-protein ligase RNF168-like [Arapaima gigas]